jgi:uncharacterized protein (UPF0261 family)
VVVPGRGVSALDRDGAPFDDPHARTALSEAVRSTLAGTRVRVEEHDLHINDDAFADALAAHVLTHLDDSSPHRLDSTQACRT